jgi:TRAP-type transport system periplasmic protein
MFTKRSLFWVGLFILSFILIQGNVRPSCAQSQQSVMKLRLGEVDPPESPFVIAEYSLAKKLKEKTNGRIDITVYPAGQLGNDKAVAEGVKLGTISMAVAGTTSSKVTDAFYLPYLFRDAEHQRRVMNGPVGQVIKERFNKDTGMIMIGGAYFAARHLTTKDREVKSPADLKGLRIRVPQIPAMVATWKALGASPTPINFTELFTALQQGTVDAQENPYSLILMNSYFEVQKYLIQTYHVLPMRFFFMNDKLWSRLNKEDQMLFVKTWEEEAVNIEKMFMENEQKWLDQLKGKGMKIVAVDTKPFREAVRDVWKEYAPTAWGEGVYERIQAQ